ncbi:MAG: alkaline phosphatase family protein [Candidatus Riflebacteria bacterium]|nr:alkaline phosphatase family protein [Candidatus Riflebacteria bacterium]
MKTLALFTFIDAFGWELLRKNSFLEEILSFRTPVQTIFGYSSTCDPTIITGLLPRDHGHFSFFVYDPENSPFKTARILSLLPKFISSRGRVRNIISRFYKKYLGYSGYFQLYNMPFRMLSKYDYTEKCDIYEKGGINSGASTVFDRLRNENIPFFLADWRASEDRNIEQLSKCIEEGKIRFSYLYLAAMDAVLHKYGTDSEHVRTKIAWYENEIKQLVEQAKKKYSEVKLYIFSDHGMTNVNEDYDLMSIIAKLPLKQNRDFSVVYDSTMARFWFLRDKAREIITNELRKSEKGRILSDETLHDWGCDFRDRRYGDLFFLLNPGVLLCPSYMGETSLAGMHGYTPYDKDSTAMFASTIKPEIVPERLDDINKLMHCEINRL